MVGRGGGAFGGNGAFGDRVRLRVLAERYRAFAVDGARGEFDIYEELALAVASSPELLAFLIELPPEKRFPNLFFGAVRHLHGVPRNAADLVDIVRRDRKRVRELMLARTTQTNEPARCALLLPLLAALPQPLALVEIGASAGLCLIPERYGYDYGAAALRPPPTAPGERAPTFACRVTGPVPLPQALPQIVWRAGLDLDPIDVRSDEAVGWLETLIWPGQDDRAARLRAAVAVARRDPPRIVRGDLRHDLAPLLAQAPREATLVVFHIEVLRHLRSADDRDRFAEAMLQIDGVWISNEPPSVFESLAEEAPAPPHRGLDLLMVDGVPVAWTGPHGQSIDWFGPSWPELRGAVRRD